MKIQVKNDELSNLKQNEQFTLNVLVCFVYLLIQSNFFLIFLF